MQFSHVINAPPAQLDGGWVLATSRDKTVTIGVPGGWRFGVDTTLTNIPNMPDLSTLPGGGGNGQDQQGDQGFGAQVGQMAQQMQQDSQKQEEAGLEKLEKKGIILNVMNSAKPIPGEQRTRFYVLRNHGSGSTSLEDAAEAERYHFSAEKPAPVTLPIGPAYKITKDDSLRDGMTLHQISFVVVYDEDTYDIRFETEEDAMTIQNVADQVAKSIRIVPARR